MKIYNDSNVYYRDNNDNFSGADVELAQIIANKLEIARFRWLKSDTWGRPIDKAKKVWTGIVGNVSRRSEIMTVVKIVSISRVLACKQNSSPRVWSLQRAIPPLKGEEDETKPRPAS